MTLLKTIETHLSHAWSWINGFDLRLRLAAAALILIGGGFFALLTGFMIGKHDWPLSRIFTRIDLKLYETLVMGQAAPTLADRQQTSALVQLDLRIGSVATARSGPRASLSNVGGGLTSFGDDVLLLTYDGDIFAAASPRQIRRSAVAGPRLNRSDFLDYISSESGAAYDFQPGYLRYNDLEYFRLGERQGLIASYTEYHPDRVCVTNTLATLDFAPGISSIDQVEAVAADWRVLYRTEPCLPFKTKYVAMEGHMAGGRIVLDEDGRIYLASGDFHWDGMRSEGDPIAQDPDQPYGKVIRVDLATGQGEMVSLGHRNPQGITQMPGGEIVVVEHGPGGGDEVNIIRDGANYGWPLESYGLMYSGGPLPGALSYGRHETFEAPVFAFVPSVATSTAMTVEGFDPAWDGDLLVGSLLGQSLFRLRPGAGGFVYSEPIPIGTRIRDIHQHRDGQIVVWTDNEELIFIRARAKTDSDAALRAYLDKEVRPDALREQVYQTLNRCVECHALVANDHRSAPSLAAIYEDPIASTPYPGYSAGLKAMDGRWTRDALIAYLEDPNGFAPGTIMPDPGIANPIVIDAIIDYLAHLNRDF